MVVHHPIAVVVDQVAELLRRLNSPFAITPVPMGVTIVKLHTELEPWVTWGKWRQRWYTRGAFTGSHGKPVLTEAAAAVVVRVVAVLVYVVVADLGRWQLLAGASR
jgi:hypothetical protein